MAKNGKVTLPLTVPSPFLDLDTPISAWIYPQIATSLPLTGSVIRPFPILSPFPLPFPHRVVSATAVQPPLAQRAPTVLSIRLTFF